MFFKKEMDGMQRAIFDQSYTERNSYQSSHGVDIALPGFEQGATHASTSQHHANAENDPTHNKT